MKLLLLLSLLVPKEQAISLHLSRSVCFAPCEVEIRVTIPKSNNNRFFVLQIDNEDYLRSTYQQLDEYSPKTFYFFPPHIGEGVYEVKAILYDNHGETVRVRQTLIVKGTGQNK